MNEIKQRIAAGVGSAPGAGLRLQSPSVEAPPSLGAPHVSLLAPVRRRALRRALAGAAVAPAASASSSRSSPVCSGLPTTAGTARVRVARGVRLALPAGVPVAAGAPGAPTSGMRVICSRGVMCVLISTCSANLADGRGGVMHGCALQPGWLEKH